MKAVITDFNLISAYGLGVDSLWDGLLSNKSAIKKVERFPTNSFQSENAACINGLKYLQEESLAVQMLGLVFAKAYGIIPQDAFLMLASTVGEIDLLEKAYLNPGEKKEKCTLNSLFLKIRGMTKVNSGVTLSCACASSGAAIARGAEMIRSGEKDCVLIVALDCVTEFVFSGFSALMALDKKMAKPFDRKREGLSLGEAAGFILLMSEERAKAQKRAIYAEVAGWGLSCDANHMTGPSRDAGGLKSAIHKALSCAGVDVKGVGCISAHGTGTLYNDAMEMRAFRSIFKDAPLPVYSVKGGTGHTLGTAGLVEAIVVLKVLKEGIIPPTVNLEEVDDDAQGWVSQTQRVLTRKSVLSNNCGFGGINAALLFKDYA
jgi:3-oxoacyl-[acyl-carrier-protein] synthase II